MYDTLIIGSGPGGYVAAARSAQLGLKTAIIDERKELGGTCLNVGCIPSKALLNTTEHYSWFLKEGAKVGVESEKLTLDFTKMMENKKTVVQGLVSGVSSLMKKHGIDVFTGVAKLKKPNLVEITSENEVKELTAKNIILATGSTPVELPFLKFDEKKVLSSTGALSLERAPKKMIVIGAGVIGVELASVYQRLGTEVILIEMLDRICPNLDEALSKALLQSLKKQGLTFHLGAKVLSADTSGPGVRLEAEIAGQKTTFEADTVLVAVGRRPNHQNLMADGLSLKLTSKGFIEVDSSFCTSLPSVFAIGDLIDGPMLAHKASEEGYALAELLAGKSARVHYAFIPNVIYTHPEAASLGLTEAEAKQAGFDVATGSSLIRGNPRARCIGETDGLIKVIGDKKSGRLLGMHIMSAGASEMIGEGVIAMVKSATLHEIASAPHAHPTLSEAIKEACLNALGAPLHG